MPPGFAEKISKLVRGKNNPMYGHHHTQEVKDFISKNNTVNKSKLGKITTEESKRKMREAALNRIERLGRCPSYNTEACSYMDSLRPIYNFQHALNGGEFHMCGYSVDGYDKEKILVFEYDEPHHYIKKTWQLKERDIKRMDEIRQKMGCGFLRYDERNNRLTTY
jgi:NUMOD3 motif